MFNKKGSSKGAFFFSFSLKIAIYLASGDFERTTKVTVQRLGSGEWHNHFQPAKKQQVTEVESSQFQKMRHV